MITIVIATHLIFPLITTVLNSMSWYVCFFLEKQATIVLPKVNDKGIISYLSYNGV